MNRGTFISGATATNSILSLNCKTNYGTILINSSGTAELILNSLERNDGTISKNNNTLRKIILNSMTISRGIIADDCINLEEIEMNNLEYLGGSTSRTIYNTKISSLNFPKLKEIYYDSTTTGDPNYALISGNFITSISMPKLEVINFNLYLNKIIGECPIESLSLPLLREYHQRKHYGRVISENTHVKEVLLPNLELIRIYADNENNFIRECSELLHVQIGTLIECNSSDMFKGCPKLIDIELGQDSSTRLPLRNWYPSFALDIQSDDMVTDEKCTNNLEQFLYNFREHIIKRLYTRVQKEYVYLNQNVKPYILGEDSSHYASTWIVPGESDTYLNTLNDELTTRNWGLA